MTAALLSVLIGARLRLTGAECVEKSCPDFFEQLERAGIRVTT